MHTLPRRTTASASTWFAVLLVACSVLAGCGTVAPDDPVGSTPPSGAPSGSTSAGASSSPADPQETDMGDQCEYVQDGTASRPVNLPPVTGVPRTGKVAYVITTNQGDVKITLDRAKAPCTVNSFTSLVGQGFYDQTRCHRLADNGLFMLQCGDPTGTGKGGPGYTLADEVTGNEVYAAGTVAMANDSRPNTGGSQFFLVYLDSDLPPGYTVFGTIDRTGLGVVNRIAAEGQDGSNPDGTGRPNNPAEIIKIMKS